MAEQNLSTYVDYKIKKVPVNVTIKEGETYRFSDGSGVMKATVEAIRQLGEDILVYYKINTLVDYLLQAGGTLAVV